jgi:FAD/FMN-containing dehydrogenase
VAATLSRDEDVRVAFAADASGLHLVPDAVARPTSVAEVVEIVREARASGTPITAAGAQTSTTAASISDSGIILSLRGMDRVLDVDPERRTVRVEPGALVGDVKRAAVAHELLFPPDPTGEDWSTIGGAIACNASGARSLRYGATRPYVASLRVVLASGELVELRRPRLEKNTAGYALAHDPVDWFVGSEGTLGVIVEAELSLLPLPRHVVGLGLPFASESAALAFVVAARESALVRARCLEFFDEQALAIARDAEAGGGWASGARGFVYAEDSGTAPDVDAEAPLDEWLTLAERHEAVIDDVRVFEGEASLRAARAMRHAVPSRMNERGAAFRASGGRKVSTDWAVPYRQLAPAIDTARGIADRHGVEQAVTYGHAGNGHPHQNFIARDAGEVARIEGVVEETLRHVLSLGGTVAAEHGIGKLKRRWLPLQLTPLQLSAMRALKRELDPQGLLAPGNVL